MPVLIIGWIVYDKLPEVEQKEFALERLGLIISMSVMSMRMQRGMGFVETTNQTSKRHLAYW